jgi:hypothetical protein
MLRNKAGGEIGYERRKPSLVVAALATVLRGQPGRNLGANDDTGTRSGETVSCHFQTNQTQNPARMQIRVCSR